MELKKTPTEIADDMVQLYYKTLTEEILKPDGISLLKIKSGNGFAIKLAINKCEDLISVCPTYLPPIRMGGSNVNETKSKLLEVLEILKSMKND